MEDTSSPLEIGSEVLYGQLNIEETRDQGADGLTVAGSIKHDIGNERQEEQMELADKEADAEREMPWSPDTIGIELK